MSDSGAVKPTILAFHGSGSNATIHTVQLARLNRVLKEHFNVESLEGAHHFSNYVSLLTAIVAVMNYILTYYNHPEATVNNISAVPLSRRPWGPALLRWLRPVCALAAS